MFDCVGASSSRPVSRILVARRLSITPARRGTLKWCKGSKRMMVAFWPERGIDGENLGGRMAWAIMRLMSEVLPGLEGWCVGGGDISSRMGVEGEGGRRVSRAGIEKMGGVLFELDLGVMLLVGVVG